MLQVGAGSTTRESGTIMASTAHARVPRRTVARAAAWSVPVVTLAASAPAFASSKPATTSTIATGCKPAASPGKKFEMLVTICNNTAQTMTITFQSMTVQQTGTTWTALSGTVSPTTVAAGQCASVLFTGTFQDASVPNSGTATLTVAYNWTSGTGGTAQSGTQTASGSLTITGC
jgi:hypothetical protein